MISSYGFSQSLPFTFDESTDPAYYFTCFDCNFVLATDPDDASNPVGQLTGFPNQNYDTAQTLNLSQNIDLSDDDNNTITFRFRPVNGTGSGSHLLKFEGGAPIVELPFTSTGTEWQTITINFGSGLGNYSNMIIFPDFFNASSDTYLIDDISGGTNVGPPPMPDGPAPTPSTADASVFRLYGDTGTYTNNMAYDYTFGTLGGEFDLDDTSAINKALQFNFNVAGWGAGQNNSTNVSTAQFVHFDYWATNATDFKLFIISKVGAAAAVETTYEVGTAEAIVLEAWTSVSIPIANFTAQGFDVNNYLQYKYDVTSVRPGIVYIDNLYFSDVPPTALGVSEVEALGFQVYPNPSQNEWIIKNTTIISSVVLYDVVGKQVLNLTPETATAKIDASQLSKGIYLARINANGATKTVKLIKN